MPHPAGVPGRVDTQKPRRAGFLLQDPSAPTCPLSHWSWPPAPRPSALPDTAGEERVACRPTCFCFLCLDLVEFQQLCCLHKERHCSPLQCGGGASSEKQMPSALPWRLPVAERRSVRLRMAPHTAHGWDVLTTVHRLRSVLLTQCRRCLACAQSLGAGGGAYLALSLGNTIMVALEGCSIGCLGVMVLPVAFGVTVSKCP